LNVLPTSRLPTSSPQPGICHMDAILSLPQSVTGPSEGANPIWLQHPKLSARMQSIYTFPAHSTRIRDATLWGSVVPRRRAPGLGYRASRTR
jgi:hypothetical protein